MELIVGIGCLVISIIYFIYLKKKDRENNFWDMSMSFRGTIGALGLLILGIVLIYKNVFN